MRRLHKVLSIILSIIMSGSVIPVTASAAVKTGTCGDNVTWVFDTITDTLTISGFGEMYNYSCTYNLSPFKYLGVEKVIINEGVTSIGVDAFDSCYGITSVIIPDSVTSIGAHAFYDCFKIENVTIPNSVTSIGFGAFSFCSGITELIIPNSVTSIGDYAFDSCTSLTSITFGKNVTSFGENAFYGCYSLDSIIVDNDSHYYSSNEEGVLFNKDKTKLVLYPRGKQQTNYIVPGSVKTIDKRAFAYCNNLTEVTIPDSVKIIDEYAFSWCRNLKNVTIGNGVTTIGYGAFWLCDSLTSVTIPAGVTLIDKRVFENCDNLKTITVDSDNQYYSSDKSGVLFNKDKTSLVFYPNGKSQSHYTIPDSVTTIGEYAFGGCNQLESLTIGNSVATIEKGAFYDCNSLTDVYYTGTEEQWEAISIGDNNAPLRKATIHYATKTITQSTCTEQGYTTYSWDGREVVYICDYVDALGHDFLTPVYTAPPCVAKGYTMYECHCGVTCLADYVDITGHIDSDSDGICNQCNKQLETSATNTPDTEADTSGMFSIFSIIIELLKRLLNSLNFLSV